MATTNLSQLIEAVIKIKKGNKEFALFYDPHGAQPWTAEIGNGNETLLLGEADAEVSVVGRTPDEAVANLISATVKWNDKQAGRHV